MGVYSFVCDTTSIIIVKYVQKEKLMSMNCIAEEIKEEPMEEDEENEIPAKKPVFTMKKSKSRPDMAIRRKQLKAKSKAISDQIKKRKQLKKKNT